MASNTPYKNQKIWSKVKNEKMRRKRIELKVAKPYMDCMSQKNNILKIFKTPNLAG